jgi:hypothetical protein
MPRLKDQDNHSRQYRENYFFSIDISFAASWPGPFLILAALNKW